MFYIVKQVSVKCQVSDIRNIMEEFDMKLKQILSTFDNKDSLVEGILCNYKSHGKLLVC